jgi:hypothetical protein
MIKKTFTGEGCLYWIKSKGFKKWKLAIYNDDKKQFRLVSNVPVKKNVIFKKEECQFIVNTSRL